MTVKSPCLLVCGILVNQTCILLPLMARLSIKSRLVRWYATSTSVICISHNFVKLLAV